MGILSEIVKEYYYDETEDHKCPIYEKSGDEYKLTKISKSDEETITA